MNVQQQVKSVKIYFFPFHTCTSSCTNTLVLLHARTHSYFFINEHTRTSSSTNACTFVPPSIIILKTLPNIIILKTLPNITILKTLPNIFKDLLVHCSQQNFSGRPGRRFAVSNFYLHRTPARCWPGGTIFRVHPARLQLRDQRRWCLQTYQTWMRWLWNS